MKFQVMLLCVCLTAGLAKKPGKTDQESEGNAGDLDQLFAEISNLKQELAKEKQYRETTRQELSRLKEQVQSLNNEHILEKNVTKNAEQIVFSVHTESSFGPVTVQTKIPFPVANINIGGGWRPSIDAFQAPVAGHYFLVASICSQPGTHPHTRIVHTDDSGSTHVAAMLASGSERNADSNAVVLFLEEGDFVSVQLTNIQSGVVYSSGHRYTTFSGFLLF